MSDTSSGVWASNMSRSRAEPRRRVEPSRHMAQDSEDGDSVFDDGRGQFSFGESMCQFSALYLMFEIVMLCLTFETF